MAKKVEAAFTVMNVCGAILKHSTYTSCWQEGMRTHVLPKGSKPVTSRPSQGVPDHQLLWPQTGAAGNISDSPSGAHSPGSTLE